MYTRCSECETAFRVTVAQLKVRDGLVRCGRCDSVFRADLRLFAPPADSANRSTEDAESEMFIELAPEETDAIESARDLPERSIPVVSDLSLFQEPRRGLPFAVWFLAALALGALLLGQFAYFFRPELAQLQEVRPALAQFCAWLECEVPPMANAGVPELIRTNIAPHPRYANALRVRASLANRTQQTQPLPLLQMSLTDSSGQLLARRTFAPHEYLDARAAATPLDPNVVAHALLDVTNPDNKAAGYEVQLFPQQSARVN
jgi:predicted Zn finger-like uncharacterized protein